MEGQNLDIDKESDTEMKIKEFIIKKSDVV